MSTSAGVQTGSGFESPWIGRVPLLRLLRGFPASWPFWWLVMPNVVSIAMWPIGGPAMATTIFVSGVVAIVCSQQSSVAFRTLAAGGIFLTNSLFYLASSFNMKPIFFIPAIHLAAELEPTQSIEYVVAGTIAALCFVLTIRHAPRVRRFTSRDHYMLALVAAALLTYADNAMTAGTRGSYKAAAPAGTPIDSAILQNGITPATVASRNLVIVMVESMGASVHAHDRALFEQIWNPARWSARYDVKQGSSLYFGSTTGAELRELCGVWSTHDEYDFDRARCLPQEFAKAGFHTVAVHSFTGVFFDRETWYPKIGFRENLFGEDLAKRAVGVCGGVLAGVCDRDVPRVLGDIIRNSKSERNLVYWLTVNAHLPMVSDPTLKTERCEMGERRWREDFHILCRNLTLHKQVADAVTAEVMSSNFPEADVLIIGDHMPPFFPRAIRTRFDNGKVPWIYLRNRAALQRQEATVAEATAAGGAS